MAEKLNFPLGKWHLLASIHVLFFSFIPFAPKRSMEFIYEKKNKDEKLKHEG